MCGKSIPAIGIALFALAILNGARCCPSDGWNQIAEGPICYKAFGLGSFKYNFFEAVSICASLCTQDVLANGYKCPYLPDSGFVQAYSSSLGAVQGHIWLSEMAQDQAGPDTDGDGEGSQCHTINAKGGLVEREKCQNREVSTVVCITKSLKKEVPPPDSVEKHKKIVEQVNNVADGTWKAEYNPSAPFEAPLGVNFEEAMVTIKKMKESGLEPTMLSAVPQNLTELTLIVSGATSIMGRLKKDYEPPDHGIIPDRFDAREKWPYCAGIQNPTTNQGRCGSCWAVSASAVISDRTCIHTNGSFNRQLSAENVLNCVKRNGCGGGGGIEVFEYWIKNGLVTGGSYASEEGCQPYSHDSGCGRPCPKSGFDPSRGCSSKCRPTYSKSFHEDKHYGRIYYKLVTKSTDSVKYAEQNMKSEILERGPLWAAFFVPEDFLHYRSGVYQRVVGDLVYGHAVRIIGWGTDDGIPYWLCANSWSRDWGDNGFFKILRGSDHLFIETHPVGGMPKLD